MMLNASPEENHDQRNPYSKPSKNVTECKEACKNKNLKGVKASVKLILDDVFNPLGIELEQVCLKF